MKSNTSLLALLVLWFEFVVAIALVGCSDTFPSPDSSITWERLSLPRIDIVDQLVITPTGTHLVVIDKRIYRKEANSNWTEVLNWSNVYASPVMHVLTDGTIHVGIGEYGVRSTDDGLTWQSSGLYGMNVIVDLPGGTIYAGYSGGMFLSTDGGVTWSYEERFRSHNITSMTVDRSGHLIVADNYYEAQLLRLENDWVPIPFPPSITGGISELDVDSLNNLYLTGYEGENLLRSTYRSTDGGTTWSFVSTPPRDLESFLVVSSSNELFLSIHASRIDFAHSTFESDDGLWRSDNGGLTWVRSDDGLARISLNSLVSDGNGLMYAAGIGSYSSIDGGRTWSYSPGFGRVESIESLVGNASGNLFAGGQLLYRSEDLGASWSVVEVKNRSPIRQILAATNGDLLVSDGENLYRSTDGGMYWQRIYDSNVSDVAVNEEGYIYVVDFHNYPGVVVRSMDHGQNWDPLKEGLPSSVFLTVTNIELQPSGRPYAIADGGLYRLGSDDVWQRLAYPGGSYCYANFLSTSPEGVIVMDCGGHDISRSTDGGYTWKSIQSTIPKHLYWHNGILFAAGRLTDAPGAGVIYSTDLGDHWSSVVEGLDELRILTIGFSSDGHVFAVSEEALYRGMTVLQ